MSGPGALLASEENWETRIGKWFPGERVVLRGKDMHRDLGRLGWTELLLFAVTGRRFGPNETALVEAMCTLSIAYPDPSIWPNGVAALAASARSNVNLSVSAAIAAQDARVLGPFFGPAALELLQMLRRLVEGGLSLDEAVKAELLRRRGLPGFGRPVVPADERYEHLVARARELGFGDGPHCELLLRVRRCLSDRFGRWAMRPNIASLIGALGGDVGLTAAELYAVLVPGFSIGYLACFVDAAEKPEGTLFPLRCARIQYEGKPDRSWTVEEPGSPEGR